MERSYVESPHISDVIIKERPSMEELAERVTFLNGPKHSSDPKMNTRCTNWSIGIINFVAWLPVFKSISEVPFQRITQMQNDLKPPPHEANPIHIKW